MHTTTTGVRLDPPARPQPRQQLDGAALPGPGEPAAGGCTVLVLSAGCELAVAGRLDVSAAADVRLALVDAVLDGRGDLVLDLSALEALDATGLGVLVGAHRRAQRAGRVLVLRDVTPAVARSLFLTRLDRVLRVVRTALTA